MADTQSTFRNQTHGVVCREFDKDGKPIKESDPRMIKAELPELLPCYRGNLVPKKEGSNKNYITAEWKDDTPNVSYPPDVTHGEDVVVFQLNDSDKYYWRTTGRSKGLRNTEQTTVGHAATPEVHSELTSDDMYTAGVDTEQGKVNLFKTSTKNGEPFGWSFLVDTKQGSLTISADSGCQIQINPHVPEIYLTLPGEVGHIRLTNKNIVFFTPEDMTLVAKRQIVLNRPVITHENTEGNGATVINSKNIALNASGSFVVTAPASQIDGNLVVPKTAVIGDTYSPQYNNSGVGPTYTPVKTNTANGGASVGANAANTNGDGNIGKRHAAAFEDLQTAIHAIANALIVIHNVCDDHPPVLDQANTAMASVTASKLNKVLGE
jgi:hypothetical protein